MTLHWVASQGLVELAPCGQQAEACQQFDVCCYEERQLLHRKGILMGRLHSENASIALKFDKTTICQQAKEASRHLLTQ